MQNDLSGRCNLFWAVFFSLLLIGHPALAATEFSLTSETIVRFFERDTAEKNDVSVIPVYEYLQLEFSNPETKGFSFHAYGWGRKDLGDEIFFDDTEDGELLYGYVGYAHAKNNLNITLGRQDVLTAIGNELLDGLRLTVIPSPYLRLSAYGGLPVALEEQEGRHSDHLWGGKLSFQDNSAFQVGVSYKQIFNNDRADEELLGFDFSLTPIFPLAMYGLSTHNLDNNTWAEHAYESRFNFFSLDFRPFFQRFEYESYFNTGSNSATPFRYLAGTGETLTAYGSDIVWRRPEKWDLAFTVTQHEYDTRETAAQFYSGLLTWYGSELSQVGGEIGVMAGDAAENDYMLGRLFYYWDQTISLQPVIFLTGDLLYVDYTEKIYGQDNSLFFSLGIGAHFFDEALKVILSGDYSSDPFFESDIRGTLRIVYGFSREISPFNHRGVGNAAAQNN